MKHHDSTASKMQSASREPPGMADLSRHVPDELRDRFVAAYKGQYGYWFEFDGSVRFSPPCFPAVDMVSCSCFRTTGSETPAENSNRGIPTRFARPLWVCASTHRSHPIVGGLYHAQMEVRPHESNERDAEADRYTKRQDGGKDREEEQRAPRMAHSGNKARHGLEVAGRAAVLRHGSGSAGRRADARQTQFPCAVSPTGATSALRRDVGRGGMPRHVRRQTPRGDKVQRGGCEDSAQHFCFRQGNDNAQSWCAIHGVHIRRVRSRAGAVPNHILSGSGADRDRQVGNTSDAARTSGTCETCLASVGIMTIRPLDGWMRTASRRRARGVNGKPGRAPNPRVEAPVARSGGWAADYAAPALRTRRRPVLARLAQSWQERKETP